MDNTQVAVQNENMAISAQQPTQMLELPADYGSSLAPAQLATVHQLANSVKISSRDFVVSYGAEEQATLGKFADAMLKGKGSQELGETGQLLNDALGQISGYDMSCIEGKKGFFAKLFDNPKKQIERIRMQYQTVDQKIESIVKQLSIKRQEISKVYDDFEGLYNANKKTYQYLTLVIYAGEIALKNAQKELENMQRIVNVDPQDVRDFSDDIERFSRRLYDLKVSRTISIMLAPQIRSVQRSAERVGDSIQAAINTSIPLWKTQMAIALGIKTTQSGLDAARTVTDVNNKMLMAVAQAGKTLAVESAEASQRGVVDIDTVREVNKTLVEALTESTRITREGIEERKKNEQELKELENTLTDAVKKIK